MQSIVLEHALWQGAQFCCHVRPCDISSFSKCILPKILLVDKDSGKQCPQLSFLRSIIPCFSIISVNIK